MKKIAIVALCNNYSCKQDWFPLCVGTWKHYLTGVDKFFVSDGTLNLEQKQEIELLSGGKFLNTELYEEKINSILKQYPAIDSQRKLCVFYKRIVDFSIYFSDYDYILSIDTDIGITAPIKLPPELPDFAFCVDEVPGYSAAPLVAFKTKIITGVNAGLLLFRPQTISFDFIEEMTKKYISKGKINWWSEQTCWALIAGHLCKDVRVFSPSSVAIVSGTKKRTLNNIKQNKTTYIGKSKKIKDLQSIQEIIGSAKVIHFAGPGKPWIKPVMENAISNNSLQLLNETELLKFESLPSFSLVEKFMLFLRLLIQQYKLSK
ncbi:hypothetical protein [Anabaena sp. UHCC 0451]|uniref:hypothetical protein n=1 Tax=Anabaena sp. UHCC 0451 TaxID=2055235 RepID=UPI002B2201C3|nr:hypothetical protein [Anabaena sp. UHCC 0451]MEA5575039.1 hypothetical protein [Anabaena sp. UHCC 0451]